MGDMISKLCGCCWYRDKVNLYGSNIIDNPILFNTNLSNHEYETPMKYYRINGNIYKY